MNATLFAAALAALFPLAVLFAPLLLEAFERKLLTEPTPVEDLDGGLSRATEI